MNFKRLEIPDVILAEPQIFEDARGFFYEAYRKDLLAQEGIREEFVQDNFSRSSKGVLRGLHFQEPPRAQAKLVQVLRGRVFDVAVDLRKGSKTFGKHVTATLSGENKNMIYIPKGFAHGFLVLEDDTEFFYKASDFYSPVHEKGICWNDPELGIRWPKLDTPYLLSDKDKKFPVLNQLFRT